MRVPVPARLTALVPAALSAGGVVLCALPARAQQAAEEGVKSLPQTGDMTGAALQVAGVLCLLLAFILVGFWVLRRFGGRMGIGVSGNKQLQIEGTLGLGPKKTLVVVRFLNKRLVLGVSDANINLITEMEADDDGTRKDFEQSLDEARAKDGA